MFDSKWVINRKKLKNVSLINSLIAIRNITNKTEFLKPDLLNLYNPFLINDMYKAVERIKTAVENKEKICIYGDYDADGITSSAILIHFFKDINVEVEYFIPDRFDDGYGLNINSLAEIIKNGVRLVITTDCGINSILETEYLTKNKIDIIITDHHKSIGDLPKASAVICCTRPDNLYPYTNLSGAGIAYKLTEAYKRHMSIDIDSSRYIALAALGTVADIVPLDGENRIIVKKGIELIREGICEGINAILEVAAVKRESTDTNTLGFVIGPRINAAGRMGDAESALKLLLTDDYDVSRKTAVYLNRLNNERKNEQEYIYDKILEKFDEFPEIYQSPVIVTEGEDYNKGVIGIVASKISETYNKPTIILSDNNGIAEGSGRSNGEFSLISGLEYCKDILLKFGGHNNAAGLSLKSEDVNNFRKKICEYAEKNGYADLVQNIVNIDLEVEANDISINDVENMKLLEPFGNGNKEPVYAIYNVQLKDIKKMGSKGHHLRFKFNSGEFVFNAVFFNASEYETLFYTGEHYNIAFNASINEFNSSRNLQLILKDIALPSEEEEQNLNYLIVRILVHMIKYEKHNTVEMKFRDLPGYLYKIGMPASAEKLTANKELFKAERNKIAEVYNYLKTLKKYDVFNIRYILDYLELTDRILSLEILDELGILKVIPMGMYTYRIADDHNTDKKNLAESAIYRIFSQKED